MESLHFGNKVMPIDRYEEIDGKMIPVIKATSTEKKYPDGRVDVTIHVPVLTIEKKLN